MSYKKDNSGNQPAADRPVDLDAPEDNVIALVGFLLAFFIPFIGLICSIVGLNISKRTGSRRSLAIVGIIISAFFLLTQALLVFLIFALANNSVPFINDILDEQHLSDISSLRQQLEKHTADGGELPTDSGELQAVIVDTEIDLNWDVDNGLGGQWQVIYIAEGAGVLQGEPPSLPGDNVIHLIVGVECIGDYPAVEGVDYPAAGAGIIRESPADSFAIIAFLRRNGGTLICVDEDTQLSDG